MIMTRVRLFLFKGSLLSVALAGFTLLAGQARGQPVVVIDEDFEDGAIDGNLLNNAMVTDPGDGRSMILTLTQGQNSQSGFAWFEDSFDLRDRRVVIDFDLWIRSGLSAVPADGMSVIFQFGNNLSATGGGGGGLGTCNFPTSYVSVAFDIWDNRETNDAIDPNNTPCFDPATTRTCHVEVNQNNPCPGANASTQTNVDFGVDAPDFTTVGDTLEPIHATVVFDSGLIEVLLQTDGDPAFVDPVTVLRTSLADFPDPADAIIGFAASTGGANAHHEIDNLVVETDDPTPRESVRVRLGDGLRGAINCGSSTEVTGLVGGETFTFVPDVAFGAFLGTNEDVLPVQDLFADYGTTAGGNPAGPVAATIAAVGDDNLQNMYQTERWMNGAVAYRFAVDSGRFEVNLHFAEICPGCGVIGGEATRRIHARIEGEEALTHWSSALAAGEEAGTGPVPLTAVVRTFQVDVEDEYLDVVISDLGLLGTPPENAQVNGISYRRLGDTTGEAIQGDIEYRGPVPLPAQAEIELVNEDFDGGTAGLCPEDWSCNGTTFPPVVADFSDFHLIGVNPRLRLTDNGGSHASTAIFTQSADLDRFDFEAEFDVLLTRDLSNGNPPADGFTFFFIPGNDSVLTAVGGAGGSLAYSGISTGGFAVELDTWQGGSDPNGFNREGYGHVGVVVNGNVDAHLQHNIALDPGLVPPAWPLAPVTDPLDPELGQYLTATRALEEEDAAGIHAEVSLNNDRLQVWISTVNQDPGSGFVTPRTKVVDTRLSYGTTSLGEGFFGFSAATGGAVSWHEVDNVRITLVRNKDVQVARRLSGSIFSDSSTTVGVSLEVSVAAGTGPHAVAITETLPASWTATGISDGGSFAGGEVSWSLTDLSASTTVSYTLVPDDATRSDVAVTGTFSVGGGPELSIAPSALLWVPPPFPRGGGQAFIAEDFEDGEEGVCPEGWTCNGGGRLVPFPVGVYFVDTGMDLEARLRLADQTGDIASTVIWNEPLDLTQSSFTAEFDVFFANNDGTTPADGLTFMVLDASADTPFSLGLAGGGLGYLGLSGFAVELDTWEGGGDPSGYNTTGYGHMGVVRDGIVDSHVQTNVDLDPGTIPTAAGGDGWPHMVDRSPTGTGFPLHVEVDYNNGRIQVWLEAGETMDNLGNVEPAFPRRKVLDTAVKFPATGGGGEPVPDPVLQTAYIGFSGATGGAYHTHDVDNVEVTIFDKDQVTGGFVRGDVDRTGTVNLTDGVQILLHLFNAQGLPAPLGCLDAADADDSGSLNLTDGVSVFLFLFRGGSVPAPSPEATGNTTAADPEDCGPDPTDDPIECETPPDYCL